jgi:hypothetical protein
MNKLYLRFRVALMTFALGMAVVYLVHGLSSAWSEVTVVLPEAESGDVLYVHPGNPPHTRRPCFRDGADRDLDDCRKMEEETRAKILDGRDISKYEFGGEAGCFLVDTKKELRECERSIEHAYRFIWKHWKDRTLGYVTVSAASVDAGSKAHIFIEPGSNSRMRIVWTWEHIYGFAIEPGDVDTGTDIVTVTPKIAKKGDWNFRPGGFYLELIDIDGDTREF